MLYRGHVTRHVISFVIISNDIPLSPPITPTYHLIPIGLYSWYTKPYPSIVGNWLSYIALLRSGPAVILLLESAPSVIVLCWDSLLFLLLLLPPYNHWAVGYTSLLRIKPPAGTRRAWWPITRLAGRSKYGTVGNRRLDLWGERIFAWILSDDWSGHYERSLKPWGEWRGTPWRFKNCWDTICSRAWRARPRSSQQKGMLRNGLRNSKGLKS